MKMKINRILSFSFSKCYDLISVGPYANRVAKTVSELTSQRLSILTVQQENFIIQPSLVPVQQPLIKLQQNNYTFSEIEMGVGIRQINPDKSYIVLKNGNKYNFKQLVFSGNPADWKGQDSISTQQSKIKDYHSFIYNDMDYANIDELFARRSGSIVFIVPKDPHFGYQNYFMMLLKSRMMQKKLQAPPGLDPVQISIICQGQNLVPFNQTYNTLLQKYLSQKQITLIKNASYQIDYKKKLIKTNKSQKSLKFDSLFHYLPLKVPQVLTNAKINPFQNNRHTLNNSKYENIFILGNVVNNAYSLSAVDEMSKVMAQNIVYNLLCIRKKVLYQGYSKFNIWLSDNQCHYIQTDYNSSRLKRNLGESKLARYMMGLHKKSSLDLQVKQKINSGCQNFSFFNPPQIMNTARNQVPAVIQKPTTPSATLVIA